MADEKRIIVEQDGEVLAQARVRVEDDGDRALAQVNVAAGQLPPGTRQRMADALHVSVVEDEAQHLVATVPLGDAELIAGVREHLTDVDLRAAGATSIIEGDVKAD